MKLSDLLDTKLNIEISDIAINSNECVKNSIFFCINGYKTDGHNYVQDAINKGAVFIVSERILNITTPYIIVDDASNILKECIQKMYSVSKIKVVAITGTDGKTSTALISKHLLSSKYKTGYIGTNGIIYNNKHISIENTTPNNLLLFKHLFLMENEGIEIVIIEISSHAISLGRIKNLNIDVSILTNISQDHLDFHKSMDDYVDTKTRIFNNNLSIINKDSIYYEKFIKVSNKYITYSYEEISCDEIFINRLSFKYKTKLFYANIGFRFNIYNILASIKLCEYYNISYDSIINSLKTIPKIDGRQVLIKNVLIDFAHTPNAIKCVLNNLKENFNKEVITILGSCGNRDKLKRPFMGNIASQLSHLVIITDEDPKYENPSQIRRHLINGISIDNFIEIPNRKEAIKHAIDYANKNNMYVAVLGKGNENFQDFGTYKKEHNDINYVHSLLIK